LPLGAMFTFNNNQSSGTIVVKNNSSTTVLTVQSGAFGEIILVANSNAAGSWDTHFQAPSNVSWSTNTLSYAGSITNATWNGVSIGAIYGGTGQTSYTTGDTLYASASNTLSKLAIGSTGQVLTVSGGVPTWANTSSATTITDDTTTNATRYINFTSATSGSLTNIGTSSTKLQYNPSTGALTSTSLTPTNALGTSYGGTGLTSFTANGVVYASSTSALATGSNLTWDGSILTASNASGTNLVLNSTGNTPFLTFNQSSLSKFYIGASAAVGGGGTGYYDLYGVAGIGQRFFTNDTERMRILSNGNIGIGTSSPNYVLDLTSSASRVVNVNTTSTNGGGIAFQNSGTINGYIGSAKWITGGNLADFGIDASGSNNLIFATNDTERMRLDSSGNLGLGVTPSSWYSNQKVMQIGSILSLRTDSSNVIGFNNNAYFAQATTDWRYQTTNYSSRYDQVFGAHQWFIAPSGTAGNAISFTQAMTLDNAGRLTVGATSTISASKIYVKGALSTVENGIGIETSESGTSYLETFYKSGTGLVGSITTNGTTTSYNITSDQRLKTNIVDAPDGNIDEIKIRSFNWKSDNTHNTYGVIAQELLEVAPYAVNVPNNSDEMMGVDYSKLVPMMIKEIQSLKQRISTLENK